MSLLRLRKEQMQAIEGETTNFIYNFGLDPMAYGRYMGHFDVWLQKNRHLSNEASIFSIKLSEATPLWIVAWIMAQYVFILSPGYRFHSFQFERRCDTINPDGSTKDPTITVSTYTHAMKLRSALTYGFGRQYARGNRQWILNKENGEWEGNPSVSVQVARYMVALRRRKVGAMLI